MNTVFVFLTPDSDFEHELILQIVILHILYRLLIQIFPKLAFITQVTSN